MPVTAASSPRPGIRTLEFFAGIGLVRAALEPLGVDVVWANDIAPGKRAAYAANHHAAEFHLGDIRAVRAGELPGGVELATSSFPCVDLSLAGNRLGLEGAQSGLFWEFARVLSDLGDARPRTVLLENVPGFATSRGGADLTRALNELAGLGYSCDVFTVDARHFVPQSRPRMFIVGIRGPLPTAARRGVPPLSDSRPAWVQRIHQRHAGPGMHYLPLPELPEGPLDLSSIVERVPAGDGRWWDRSRVDALVDSLSGLQRERLAALRDADAVNYRTAYRRTRNGVPVWELRRDAVAGCLRTTGGGSSKQALAVLGNGNIRLRWMTPLEYARLMGADGYELPGATANQALFGLGDAVVVDVVRWIGEHYVLPTLRPARQLLTACARSTCRTTTRRKMCQLRAAGPSTSLEPAFTWSG